MNSHTFPLDLYLQRLGLSQVPGNTALDLKKLVETHLKTISFENLDVLSDIPISLSPEAIVEKILHQKRGGYCYELNGLLGMALEKAGFVFEPRLARVTFGRSVPGPKTHLAYVVKADGLEWLVDVGFGGPGLLAPLPYKLGAEAEQNGVRFRLVGTDSEDLHLQRWSQGKWINLYVVCHKKVLPIDIEVVNHFISTWGRSPFRSLFICVAHDPTGLITFQGQEILVRGPDLDVRESVAIKDAHDLQNKMRQFFQIEVPLDVCEKSWMKVLKTSQ